MNTKLVKKLRAVSYDLAAQWLQSMVPESEKSKITPESVKVFETKQEKYIYKDDTRWCAPYSSRWFYNKLKKAARHGIKPDFRLKNVLELG